MSEGPRPGALNLITDVPGLKVGQAQDPRVRTGVTVIVPDARATAACDVRGGGPGTRETDLLNADVLVDAVDAICLSGGSAYGLGAGDGVAAALGAMGRGYPMGTGIKPAPIVPGAILFDLANGGDKDWGEDPPYSTLGKQALKAADVQFDLGTVGAGYGAMGGALIREVGMKAALIPRFPGVTSALGCVIADIRHDAVQTLNLNLADIDAAGLQARLRDQARAAKTMVRETGLAITQLDVIVEADMHYTGQTHTLAVRLPALDPDEAVLRTAFEAAYARAFGRTLPGIGIRLVNLRVAAVGRRPRFDLATFAPGPEASLSASERGARQVWFGGWREARIYDRLLLPAGAAIPGPAILEQPDATIVIDPGLAAHVDRLGNVGMVRA